MWKIYPRWRDGNTPGRVFVSDFGRSLTGAGIYEVKASFRRVDAQLLGHSDEIGQGVCSHLLHDLPAVLLDRDLAVAELHRDLLVEQAPNHQPHHCSLLGRELVETGAQVGKFGATGPRLTVMFDGLGDGG